jgi:hypothetical protein
MASTQPATPAVNRGVTVGLAAPETSTELKPFDGTMIGRLPNEVLQIVVRCLDDRDLFATTRVGARLRALAKRRLYHTVSIPRVAKSYKEDCGSSELWAFCRSLSDRPDLTEREFTLDLCIVQHEHRIGKPTTSVLHSQMPFTPTVEVAISQGYMVGMIIQHLLKVENLTLRLLEYIGPEHSPQDDDADDEVVPFHLLTSPLICCTMSALFPGFDIKTAHLVDPPILPNIKYLRLEGGEIHWALVKGPKLEVLHLEHVCKFSPDGAPHEVSQSLEDFLFKSRSSILNPSCTLAEELSHFLAHSPSLRHLDISIQDKEGDRRHSELGLDVTAEQHGSFEVLLRALDPVAKCLDTLCVFALPADMDENDQIHYLPYTMPCEGFKSFTSLAHLHISHEVLFGPSDPQWSHIKPPPPDLLPATLEGLHIYHPDIELLDWLARLQYYKDKLPVLSCISITCSGTHGDSYEVFAFTSYPHPALAVLKSVGVEFTLYYPSFGWKVEWDEYDLEALYLVAWMKTLGAPMLGKATTSL